jgi:hypothetical protein
MQDLLLYCKRLLPKVGYQSSTGVEEVRYVVLVSVPLLIHHEKKISLKNTTRCCYCDYCGKFQKLGLMNKQSFPVCRLWCINAVLGGFLDQNNVKHASVVI